MLLQVSEPFLHVLFVASESFLVNVSTICYPRKNIIILILHLIEHRLNSILTNQRAIINREKSFVASWQVVEEWLPKCVNQEINKDLGQHPTD